MGKISTNQSGFTAVEILLVLIFVAIVGFIGVYVAHNRNDKKVSDAATTTTKSTTTKKTNSDPYAGWKSYSASDSTFSVKYPTTLLTTDCTGNGEFFGLAPTAQGLLQDCNSEPKPPYGSVIKFTSYSLPPNFDPQGTDNLNRQAGEGETAYKYTIVQLSGHKVEKVVSTLSKDAPIMSGSTTTTYRYYSDKELWEAVYTNLPDSQDLTSTFDLMVQSWKF